VARRLLAVTAVCAGLALGCPASDEGTPEAAAAVPEVETPAAQAADTAGQASETQLLREVFSYRGSGRDPFVSLLQSGDVRPFADDLRITSITYDPRYPTNSVAVIRDTVINKAYSVRVGDELGRLRVAEISPGEVVLILSEFGSERQVVLRQRRRQEGRP